MRRGNVAAVVIVTGLLFLLAVLGFIYWKQTSLTQIAESPTPTVFATTKPSATTIATSSGSPTSTPKATKSPSPTPSASPAAAAVSVTLGSNGEIDGFRSSNGGGNNSLDIRTGRNSNLVTRGFVSFDIPSSLNGKTIEKATLRLYQAKIIGSPYTAGGSVKVDHLDYGNSLENSDYSLSSISSSFGTLTVNASVEWKDLDVTDRLKDDITNNRQRSQFRIHFATENIGGDVTGDFAYFESQDNSEGTGNTPQLVVKYR